MNFAADQLDMWWPSSRAVPRRRRESFVEWRRRLGAGDDDYPARGLVGRYLCDGFEALLRNAPPNVEVRWQRARVETVRPHGDGWELRGTGFARAYDEVLVAVGHQSSSDVFRVDRRLTRERIPPGATVAIRGFALTFIDAALALTEGRAGSFEPLDHPYRVRYVPSGDEAGQILPHSRTGRPMLAKPDRSIAARVPALERIAEHGRVRISTLDAPVSLERDLLPILANTASSSHRAAVRTLGGQVRTVGGQVRTLGVRHATCAPDPVRADPVAAAIERSLDVGAGLAPPDRAWAVGHAWRALYPAIVARLSGDGLAEGDWPAFLRLAAEMERVAFGPPAVNAAKLLALIEAGRIDLTHARGGTIANERGRLVLRSEAGRRQVDVVVDAVLPGPGALGHGGLLADLIAGGHARVAPGRRGLDVDEDGSCRGRDGSVSAGLAAIGRPTEDSVIGNDTLSRGLHPQADRWARRVAALAAHRNRLREPAPA